MPEIEVTGPLSVQNRERLFVFLYVKKGKKCGYKTGRKIKSHICLLTIEEEIHNMPAEELDFTIIICIIICTFVLSMKKSPPPKPKPPPTIEDCRKMLNNILNHKDSSIDEKRKAGVVLDCLNKL